MVGTMKTAQKTWKLDFPREESFRFLDIPAEPCNEIYEYLLSRERNDVEWLNVFHFITQFERFGKHGVHLEILCVPKQVYQEATVVPYRKNTFLATMTYVRPVLLDNHVPVLGADVKTFLQRGEEVEIGRVPALPSVWDLYQIVHLDLHISLPWPFKSYREEY
ncbi:hypothetical protein K469DRAFT_695166 [Zopfia rhizophila CBS 207.26]|uniref:Uncharacterized protein n=1 Tax=Zopfia rhizophila CBS 207.26 TaxID=1314779 RepID=A0A6A6DI88_9PEZI|nr:hypothetical protein K469DRAFT_695166 [Zopfia rhizophila CBS 207.26]